MSYEYKSCFAYDIQAYISLRCSLGYSRSTYEKTLCQFDRFCRENYPDEKAITQKVTEHWPNFSFFPKCRSCTCYTSW